MQTLAIALSLTVTTLALQAQSFTRAPDFTETRRLLREGMARDSATAAAIAVVRDGAIIWEEGFGWADREKQLAATPSTPFQLASLTKTIEATLAAALHQQGRLDLDKPVNDYLRTTGVSSPVWDVHGTTIRRLMMHTGDSAPSTSGAIPDRPPRCRFPSADESIRQYGIVAQDPGNSFDYSNLGYFVASEAVARAAGRPLRDLLRDEVFWPLGMTTASMGLDSAEARRAAVAFSRGQGLIPNQPSPPGATDYANTRGFASAHDLALFAAFHLKAHRRDQRAILSDAAIDSMQLSTVPTDRSDGQRYGLGWWTEPDRYGYRSALAQGGNNLAQAWLRLIPRSVSPSSC
jgi:CubicO group peptidase (beta-lactamase class C family)